MTGDGTGSDTGEKAPSDGAGTDTPETADAPAPEPGADGSPRVDADSRPPAEAGPGAREESGPAGSGIADAVRWFLRTDEDPAAFVREFGRSAAVVLLVGLVLFGVSGVWPPMVAVESPSMEPHMQPGDLVFLMDEHRFPPAAAQSDTGVVTREAGAAADYRRFDGHGDVVVFSTPDRKRRGQPPIIHRAQFWVEEGENWYGRADPEHLTGDSCAAIRNCPAPHDGFITRGDANRYYDQVQGLSPPVRPEWIRGTAEARVPLLGCVRLYFEGGDTVPQACRL